MTVIFSKKCELGLQAVLFLSAQDEGSLWNSQDVSENLNVPKEFVSKVLQTLTASGIVGSKKGKAGGFFLNRAPKDIRLIEIVSAIDGLDMFENCVLGFRGCSVEKPCPVHDQWGKLRADAYEMLSQQNLEDLKEKTITKINDLIRRR